jgi:hypothetical protein
MGQALVGRERPLQNCAMRSTRNAWCGASTDHPCGHIEQRRKDGTRSGGRWQLYEAGRFDYVL